jgi:hypothetical protein
MAALESTFTHVIDCAKTSAHGVVAIQRKRSQVRTTADSFWGGTAERLES